MLKFKRQKRTVFNKTGCKNCCRLIWIKFAGMELELDSNYWNNRYLADDSGWNIGTVSPPLQAYFDQLTDKDLFILIPGAGHGWEPEYLWKNGFRNTYIVDIAPAALQLFSERVPDFPKKQLLCGDFFDDRSFPAMGMFDRIIEQTFFCAINPELRKQYVQQVARLLKPGGQLAGLLFDDALNTDKPPFGGNAGEYLAAFEPYFTIKTFERAHNSIGPRDGRELFINIINNIK